MFSICIIGDCIRFISRCDLLLTGFLFLLAIVNFFMRLQFLDRWMHKTKLLVKQIRLVRKNSKKVLMELPFLIEDMTTIRELYKYIKDFTGGLDGEDNILAGDYCSENCVENCIKNGTMKLGSVFTAKDVLVVNTDEVSILRTVGSVHHKMSDSDHSGLGLSENLRNILFKRKYLWTAFDQWINEEPSERRHQFEIIRSALLVPCEYASFVFNGIGEEEEPPMVIV
ncbi:hypothetical protein L3Y34_012711 [Caenorhabditis briggsae]|uniref:Uncharacterized protein n=1 Tax=Caenorhabditis briggsae TaxID=6238 RepID=A0AAE8ZWI8_CAEBR|nr:hypothetical protein L3Y34_012711 [Caenorhabditis briggsae]